MKATQQYDTSFVFASAFILLAATLVLLTLPLIQSVLEMINDSMGTFLSAFNAEVNRSLGW